MISSTSREWLPTRRTVLTPEVCSLLLALRQRLLTRKRIARMITNSTPTPPTRAPINVLFPSLSLERGVDVPDVMGEDES